MTEAQPSTTIKGPESLPKSIFEKKVGADCADVVVSKARKIKRFRDQYQAYEHTSNDDIYSRILETVDELTGRYDDRYTSILVHGAYNQQNIGVPQPTNAKRKELGLPDPFDDPFVIGKQKFDSLYMECVATVVDCIKEGFNKYSDDELEKLTCRVRLKNDSMRGAPNCARGVDANLLFQNEVFPSMLESTHGSFLYESLSLFVTIGDRLQPPGVTRGEDGSLVSKYRQSAVFPTRDAREVVFSKTRDGDDGKIGNRVRQVFNMPMITNVNLMICNAMVMENLSPKLQLIWKHTPVSMASLAGSIVHCTDFSNFDLTISPEIRYFIFDRLYSERMANLAKTMDTYPLAGIYTDLASSKDRDFDIYYYYIDRNQPEIAKEFSPLSSGTGDTALIGKICGTALQLRNLSASMNISPREIMNVGDPNDVHCIGALVIRNGGDDSATAFGALTHAGYDWRAQVEIAKKHASIIETSKIFDIKMERPGKFLGYLFHAADPILGPVHAVTHDHVSLFNNNIWQEQSVGSKLRTDPIVGLSGSLSVYRETLVHAWSDKEIDDLVDTLLYIVGWDGDEPALHAEAEHRLSEAEMNQDDEGKKAWAIAQALALTGLKNQTELDWKISTAELLDLLPDEILEQLYIILPEQLSTNYFTFLRK